VLDRLFRDTGTNFSILNSFPVNHGVGNVRSIGMKRVFLFVIWLGLSATNSLAKLCGL